MAPSHRLHAPKKVIVHIAWPPMWDVGLARPPTVHSGPGQATGDPRHGRTDRIALAWPGGASIGSSAVDSGSFAVIPEVKSLFKGINMRCLRSSNNCRVSWIFDSCFALHYAPPYNRPCCSLPIPLLTPAKSSSTAMIDAKGPILAGSIRTCLPGYTGSGWLQGEAMLTTLMICGLNIMSEWPIFCCMHLFLKFSAKINVGACLNSQLDEEDLEWGGIDTSIISKQFISFHWTIYCRRLGELVLLLTLQFCCANYWLIDTQI